MIHRRRSVEIGYVNARTIRYARSVGRPGAATLGGQCFDGIQIIQRISARGALVKKPYLALTSTMAGASWRSSARAADERERIVKPAQDGRKAAKTRGAQVGLCTEELLQSEPLYQQPSQASS